MKEVITLVYVFTSRVPSVDIGRVRPLFSITRGLAYASFLAGLLSLRVLYAGNDTLLLNAVGKCSRGFSFYSPLMAS